MLKKWDDMVYVMGYEWDDSMILYCIDYIVLYYIITIIILYYILFYYMILDIWQQMVDISWYIKMGYLNGNFTMVSYGLWQIYHDISIFGMLMGY